MNTPEAELELFTAYCDTLTKRFKELQGKERWRLLNQIRILTIEPIKSEFDFAKARKIREDLKISRAELCKKLKGNLHQITLYKYETGKVAPNKTRLNPSEYLKWLKENGF